MLNRIKEYENCDFNALKKHLVKLVKRNFAYKA